MSGSPGETIIDSEIHSATGNVGSGDISVGRTVQHSFDLGGGWSVAPSVDVGEDLTKMSPPTFGNEGVQFTLKF